MTTEPNAEVGAIHPKATPVIVTTAEAIHLWLTAPAQQALSLQRPLRDGAHGIVTRCKKKDGD